MLNILCKIVQEVNPAKGPKATPGTIVQRVREAMGTQVCSVYLLSTKAQRFALMTTGGPNEHSIGKISMVPGEGLAGLVGIHEESLNLENAVTHPHYRCFAETDEERYVSFFDTLIIHHWQAIEVLVVRQRECRQFNEGEETFLVTMSAQLAKVIVYTEATGSIRGLGEFGRGIQGVKFVGVPGASGVGVGKTAVVLPPADLEVMPDKQVDDIDAEIVLSRQTLEGVCADIRALSSKFASQLRKGGCVLFNVYLMTLDDVSISNEVKRIIRTSWWAQGVLRQMVIEHAQRLELMDGAYLRERASDVKNIDHRLLTYLQGEHKQSLTYPGQITIVSEELSPTMLGEMSRGRLVDLIPVLDLDNSHMAVLVRAMGTPTVVGVVDLPHSKIDDIGLIVDGYHGKVYTGPSAELMRQYSDIVVEEREPSRGLVALRELSCGTPGDHCMSLRVNTDLLADVARVQECGAEGVGLYCTEAPFAINDRLPNGREQLVTYREQPGVFHPLPMTMRALDISGDKALSYFPIKEDNPLLGWRGIRATLDHLGIFLVQARVMLKTSEGLDNLCILLPMVSGIHELEEALYLIHRAWGEVCDEGVDIAMPPIGTMIEIPIAMYQTREPARQVSFLSVGLSDPTRYLLAVDYNNPRIIDLYNYLRPAVLYTLKKVIDDAHLEGRPVSIRGETTGDPMAAALLMAMDLNSLSMNTINLPEMKRLLCQIVLDKARDLFGQLLIFGNL